MHEYLNRYIKNVLGTTRYQKNKEQNFDDVLSIRRACQNSTIVALIIFFDMKDLISESFPKSNKKQWKVS